MKLNSKLLFIQILIILASLTPFIFQPKFSYSIKFIASQTSESPLDVGGLPSGLGNLVGNVGGLNSDSIYNKNLDNELLLKESLGSNEIISRFLIKNDFQKYIFPAKWNNEKKQWKERQLLDGPKLFIKNLMVPIDDIYKENSHIPSDTDIAKKFFKDNFRFNYDSLNETFLVTCRFADSTTSETCANNLISFLNAELRSLHYDVEKKLNDAFRLYLEENKEIDILSRDYIQNKIASSEVNLLTIMNDPNYILIILDKDAKNYYSDTSNRLLISFLIFIILNTLYFLLPNIRKIFQSIINEIKF